MSKSRTGFFASLKNRRTRNEYIKSVLVGWSCTGIDFLITAVVMYLGDYRIYGNFFNVFANVTSTGIPYTPALSIYITAMVLGFSISLLLNYVLSVFIVYEYGNVGKSKSGFLKFGIFALIGLVITIIGSAIGYIVAGANVWILKIIITCAVFIFNFFTRKYFVFNVALIRDDEKTIQL